MFVSKTTSAMAKIGGRACGKAGHVSHNHNRNTEIESSMI